MNNSIGRKLFVWNILLVVTIFVVASLGITIFSERIYINKTEKVLHDELVLVDQAIQAKNVESAIERMETAAYRLGGNLSLYTSSGDLLYTSQQKGNGYGMMGGKGTGLMSKDHEIVDDMGRLKKGVTMSGKTVLTYGDVLKSGDVLVFQLPEEKMDDALAVVQGLLLYLGFFSILLAMVGSFLLSQHFSRPIIELKILSQKISRLDFSGFYNENRLDEIGDLGRHLNLLSTELERKINQLELELHKEKSMDAMRTQFVAQASHELQTPLTVLKNYIEALEDGMIDTDDLTDHYEVMMDEIDGMSELVTGLLDLSQLRSGQFKLSFERFDIEALLEEELDRYRGIIDKEGLKLVSEFVGKSVWIHGDSKRIKQAFRNLVDNSLKHSTGEIFIKSELIDKDYCLSVENTGVSIAEKDLKSLWDVFSKAEGNYKKGSGLGLAIVRAVIEGHDGKYGIQNTDKGVKSYFKLEHK